MSLKNNLINSIEKDDKSTDRENIITTKKHRLNPIKIKKPFDINYSKNQTIDVKKENPLLLKEDKKLINNNRLLSYFNNINLKNEYIYKDLPHKRRNSENDISNEETITNSLVGPTKLNISQIYSRKNIDKYYDNPNYIKLNSLFILPPLKKKINPYYSKKTLNITNNNYNFITEINQNIERYNSISNNKVSLKRLKNKIGNKSIQLNDKDDFDENEDHKHDNIYSFMKFKYYEDVNEKYEKKLRDDSFIDRGVKDKIIKIGEVGTFWRNVFEYCGSFIFAEKFKNIKKQFRKKYMKSEEEDFNLYKINKTPNKKIYTNLFVNKIIHYQNNNKNNF